MVGGKQEGEDEAKWSDKNEEIFLQILLDRVKKDPNGAPTFKSSDWNDIDQEMFLASREKYGGMKLVGKYNRLRVKHRQFSELLEHTGVTYLSSLNTVNTPEDVWQMFFLKNRNYRTFRRKGCPHYELLGLVFNKSTATGHLRHSSSQFPPTSDEERQNEEEFLNHGVHIDVGDGTPDYGSSQGKRPSSGALPAARRAKKGKSSKLDSYMDQFASSQSAKTEYFNAKAKKYKNEQAEVTSPNKAADSIVGCIEAMGNVDEVSDAAYNKALERFKDPYWRKVFATLSIEKKRLWLQSLEWLDVFHFPCLFGCNV